MMWYARTLGILLVIIPFIFGNEERDYKCSVKDGEHIYDLSELAKQDHWKVVETLHTKDDAAHTYYLSVCHPLRKVPDFCKGHESGICTSKVKESTEEAVLVSGGKVPRQGPVVNEQGRLSFKYEEGSDCNGTGNHTTWLYFICPKAEGSSETDGPVLMSNDGCQLTFVWITRAACPRKVESTNIESCTVKFSNLDHALNLHSLHVANFYNVSSHGNQFEMNICGAIEQGHCSSDNVTVCDITDAKNPKVLGTTKEMKLEWKNASLMLKYFSDEATVQLEFQCDRTASKRPYIRFVSQEEGIYKFLISTSHICSPESPECTIHDSKGQMYNLWQLHKKNHNWEAIDRSENKTRLYHINVCGPVNEDLLYHCPEGHIGACQTGVTDDSAFNLGYLTSQPVVNKDGTITIVYTGGDTCKNGQHSRSTHITLVCSKEEHGPVMVDETDMCEYIFTWYTPAACPYNVIQGHDCKVTDPLYGYQFDLSPLRKEKDYEVSDGISTYLVNICGPLLSGCGESNDAGICKVDGKENISYGVSNSVVTFNDGTLTMELENGSKCNENHNRSAKIIFMCNHDAQEGEKEPISYLPSDECTTIMVWYTKQACPPHRVIDCSVMSKDGHLYDLSSLSSSDKNEEYFSSDKSKKYVLNVCRSVVHSKTSRCSYNAGACIMDLKHKNETINIGDVKEGPYLDDDNKLKLKYKNGDLCGEGEKHYETLIEFKCDRDERYPFPQVIAQEKCRVVFEWATAAACPVDRISTTPKPSDGDCSVTNPYTGFIYDLSSLTNSKGYEVLGQDGLHIFLNICDDVQEDRCKSPHDGACSWHHNDTSKVVSAGKANADLKFHPGMVYLVYSGGDRCPNGKARSSVINFICGAENSFKGPVLIKDDLEKCTYQINWHTDEACERRIRCYVNRQDKHIDLSPLIQVESNYEVTNPNNTKEKFYLNVCRPLNPIIGITCHPGSSACLTNEDMTDMALSLGHPLVTPIYTGEGDVQMMYSHGSQCLTNKNISTTTRIIFKCNKTVVKGEPVFKEVTHDCQYVFEWHTSLVCEHEDEPPNEGLKCQIAYPASRTNIDLRPLIRPQGYVVMHGNRTFNISVCGSVCNGKAGVCTENGENFGLSEKTVLKWDYDKLRLAYYGGDNCSDALTSRKSASIFFECDMQAGFGYPEADEFMADLMCTALFNWKTNITCIEGIYSNGNDSPNANKSDNDSAIGERESSEDTRDNTSNRDGDSPSASNISSNDSPEDPSSSHPLAINIVTGVFVTAGIVFVVTLLLMKTERGQNIISGARRSLRMSGYATVSPPHAENSSLLNSSCRVFHVDDNDDDLLRV